MLTEQQFKELLEYKTERPVLSVFLNIDPTQRSVDGYKLRLRGMLKDLAADKDRIAEDISAVEQYIEHEYDWSGRALAVFSCASEGFFRAYPIQVPVRSRARVMPQPYVKPLADLLDSYGHYGVALVDKQGARLFHFHLGELREQEGTVGEAVKHTKRGGASSMPGRRGGTAGRTRHEEEKVARNMRDSAEFAVSFFADNGIRRILLGGTEDNVSQFRSELPKAWQERVMGNFPSDMIAGHAEVLERAMEVARRVEQERTAKLVQAVVTAAAKGQAGVIRLDDTLSAVHEGRVQVLVMHEGYRAPGRRCRNCGYVTTQVLEACPFCGGAFEEIEDAVEEAIRRVMADGGDVEVVRNSLVLREAGNIGALLRY